jgi:hypothetical protein
MSARSKKTKLLSAALLFPATLALAGGPLPKLPDLQVGQWKMSGPGEWSACGHPLKSTYDEYEQFGKLREFGCSVDVTSSGARSVAVHVICPEGSRPGKVDSAFTLSSPNPQSFSIESKDGLRPGRSLKTLKGVRIGEC